MWKLTAKSLDGTLLNTIHLLHKPNESYLNSFHRKMVQSYGKLICIEMRQLNYSEI